MKRMVEWKYINEDSKKYDNGKITNKDIDMVSRYEGVIISKSEDNYSVEEKEILGILLFKIGVISKGDGNLKFSMRKLEEALDIYIDLSVYDKQMENNVIIIYQELIDISFEDKTVDNKRKIDLCKKICAHSKSLQKRYEGFEVYYYYGIKRTMACLDEKYVYTAYDLISEYKKEFEQEIKKGEVLDQIDYDVIIKIQKEIYTTFNVVCKNYFETIESNDTDEKDDISENVGMEEDNDNKNVEKEENNGNLRQVNSFIQSCKRKISREVIGQDHVIEAATTLLWDYKLWGQMCILFLTGAPGCGKTLLAGKVGEVLGLPCKKFTMSEYAFKDSLETLIGFDETYKDSKEGILTGFVKKNPKSVIIFDEIEKAGNDVLQLLLQVLDCGKMHDIYLNEDISFENTIMIFTSNVGKKIYENDEHSNLSGVTQKELEDALVTEINPVTNTPFFSQALVSRFSKGTMCIFNKLAAENLVSIAEKSLKDCSKMFEENYGIRITWDKQVPIMLLLSEGELADARKLTGKAEKYIKEQLRKTVDLYDVNGISKFFDNCKEIHFSVDLNDANEDVGILMKNSHKMDTLIVQANKFADKYKNEVKPRYDIICTDEMLKIESILKNKPIGKIFINIREESHRHITGMCYKKMPITANKFRTARVVIKNINEKYPEIPIFLIEDEFDIDTHLEKEFINIGVRRIIRKQDGKLKEKIEEIDKNYSMQKMLDNIISQHKFLDFDTVPIDKGNSEKVTLRIRNLTLKQQVKSSDREDLVSGINKPNVKMEDVIGGADAKKEMEFAMKYLKNPEKYIRAKVEIPKGILLYGPPGTGKTMLAKAFANECNANFISAKGSEFVKSTTGSGPENMRELFIKARRYAPCVVFIDEIDAIGSQRGNVNAHSEEMTLNALLTEIDGFDTNKNKTVMVIAATNAGINSESGYDGIGRLDEALVRRFDSCIFVDLPTTEERKEYLKKSLMSVNNNEVSEEMIQNIADRSIGASLATLESVKNKAIRESVMEDMQLTNEILDNAFETMLFGREKTGNWGKNVSLRVARHETGHTFISYINNVGLSYVTISSRGNYGGYVQHTGSNKIYTKNDLLKKIDIALAGRAAEIVYYGEEGIGTGASQDILQATRIAKAMICDFGMDNELGIANIGSDEMKGELGLKVNSKVNAILNRELEKVIKLIVENRNVIDNFVEVLLERNHLKGSEIKRTFEICTA